MPIDGLTLSAGYAHLNGRYDSDDDGVVDELDQLAEERHGPGADAREAPACRGLWSRSGRSLFQKPDAASDAVFPPLGYASAALKSYRTFEKLLADGKIARSEEHTSELQSLMRISYAVFCLQNKTQVTKSHM